MYIIELYFKIKEKIKNGKKSAKKPVSEEVEETLTETCEHIFSPVDSTNTTFACVKCGCLIHANPEDFKKKNIFET